eukprot:937241_1
MQANSGPAQHPDPRLPPDQILLAPGYQTVTAVNGCCCCFSLENGTLIVAGFGMLGSVLMLFGVGETTGIRGVDIALALIGFTFAWIGLQGAFQTRLLFVKIYFRWMVASLVFQILFVFVVVTSGKFQRDTNAYCNETVPRCLEDMRARGETFINFCGSIDTCISQRTSWFWNSNIIGWMFTAYFLLVAYSFMQQIQATLDAVRAHGGATVPVIQPYAQPALYNYGQPALVALGQPRSVVFGQPQPVANVHPAILVSPGHQAVNVGVQVQASVPPSTFDSEKPSKDHFTIG